VRSAASLEAAAKAARRNASHVTTGKAPSDAAATAIHWAFQEIGIPYSWGGGNEDGPTYGFAQGANTKGFDCSGLTLFAYGKTGIHLDHYTGSQWGQGKRISSRADLQPGDLMFFATDTSDPSTIHHVAIFLGNDKMIEAPQTGEVVRVASSVRDDFIGGTRPWQS
jgi:cell wall-associated NlpC family hydrolase